MAAVDDKFGLSRDGKIPWRQTPEGKADMDMFRTKTQGAICIMGRGTYKSLLPRLLPGRDVVVISSKLFDERVRVFTSVKNALEKLQITDADRQVIICGGRDIYMEALQLIEDLRCHCTEISITRIPGDWECDHTIPEFVDYISPSSASRLSI